MLRHKHQETEAQLAEMHDRVQLLERASRQLEGDNETLVFKVCVLTNGTLREGGRSDERECDRVGECG